MNVIYIRNIIIPTIGFVFMITGPLILYTVEQYRTESILINAAVTITETTAETLLWTAVFLPGIGAALCIFSLLNWKKLGKFGRILSITVVIICNPIFYFLYYLACAFTSAALANQIAMWSAI